MQLNCIFIGTSELLEQALCSWWIFRTSTSQLVDFHWQRSNFRILPGHVLEFPRSRNIFEGRKAKTSSG